MSLPIPTAKTTAEDSTDVPKWFGELVDTHFGSLDEIAQVLPQFERRPSRLSSELRVGESSPGIKAQGENKVWDLIVRVPALTDELEMPDDVVSNRSKHE